MCSGLHSSQCVRNPVSYGSLSSHSTVVSMNRRHIPLSTLLATPSMVVESVWYSYSGAIVHMTNDPMKFTDHRPYNGASKVLIGNGQSIPITHIGGLSIFSTDASPLLLKDLLYALDIHKNLLSMSKFAKDNKVFFLVLS